jgi:hypothetical protein
LNEFDKELIKDYRRKLVVKEIRKVSPKMAKALVQYTKKKKVWIKGKMCIVYPHLPATTVHHAKGRSSIELLLDETYWKPASLEGHIWIENHPKEAKERGFSLDRLATEPKI